MSAPLSRHLAAFPILPVTLVFLVVGQCPPSASAASNDPALYQFGYNPHPDFVAFDPHYPTMHDRLSKDLESAHAEMIRQQRAGRKTFCTRQIYLEAHWLVYYTADYVRAQQRIDDLRRMLAQKKDPHEREQVDSDGSFAPCCNAWWLRLDMTCDELVTMSYEWRKPKYPVKLLEKINSPQRLRDYLDSLLISDIRKTGINNALELNMAGAADLQRFIFYQGTNKELPTRYDLDPGLRAALLDFEDNHWQDPKTGFWGAWFRAADGSIVKTCDLSTTFHLVSYRNGEGVKHWPEMVDTTLAMKTGRFPYGWLEEGKYISNHHNLDIVRLWHLAWPNISPEQRQRVAAGIDQMLDFCLHQSLQPDGSFKAPEEDTLSSSFYFGVSFLHEIGYFTQANRFWTDRAFPEAQAARKRILDRIQALKLDDSEATWTLWLLRLDRE